MGPLCLWEHCVVCLLDEVDRDTFVLILASETTGVASTRQTKPYGYNSQACFSALRHTV
jgi:hypothetical protein